MLLAFSPIVQVLAYAASLSLFFYYIAYQFRGQHQFKTILCAELRVLTGSRRQLYLGLCGRMVGALVVSAAGLLVILAVEFALATGLPIFVLFLLSVLGIIFLTWAGVVGVLIGLVWLVALWCGQAEPSDLRGKETVRTTLGRAIAERQAPLGLPSEPPNGHGCGDDSRVSGQPRSRPDTCAPVSVHDTQSR